VVKESPGEANPGIVFGKDERGGGSTAGEKRKKKTEQWDGYPFLINQGANPVPKSVMAVGHML